MSRKQCPDYVVVVIAVISLVLGSVASWAMGKTPPPVPRTWVVHLQRFDVGGQSGMWPESTSTPGIKRNLPWLHRSHGDKIQFVINFGADSCQLAFDDTSPLVPLGDPNTPANTIQVFPVGSSRNQLYVVSPKLKIDKDQFCQYWFRIIGNPDCGLKPHTCEKGSPISPPHQNPCWSKDKPLQIGPGMDVSD
jgi:hypothetical protein